MMELVIVVLIVLAAAVYVGRVFTKASSKGRLRMRLYLLQHLRFMQRTASRQPP
jgi:type II secretory pathway pseudopilin PulG